jgi:hypothetical protein
VPPQLENQADKGGGAARSAKREDTAPQDVPYFLVEVGDQRSPSFFLFFLSGAAAYHACANPAPRRMRS